MTRCFASLRSCLVVILALTLLTVSAFAQRKRIIVRSATASSSSLRERVRAMGGKVRHELRNMNAVSAEVSPATLRALASSPDLKLSKSAIVYLPKPRQERGLSRTVVRIPNARPVSYSRDALVKRAVAAPADYLFNNALINATPVQAGGNFGDDVIVAVIDTGVANNPDVVNTLAGSVIGGESFIPPEEDPVTSPTSTKNGDHGTWVSSVIAGHGAFLIPNDECLIESIQQHSPESILDGTPFGFPGQSILPIVGVAPGAKIYALKVFGSDAEFTSTDVLLAALDRVLTLKTNFLAGKPSAPISGTGTEDDPFVYDSLDIKVVNFSIGGGTGAAGRDLIGLFTQKLLAAGITMAVAASNTGPDGLTLSEAAAGLGSIAAGATTDPIHERILYDVAGHSDGSCDLDLGNLVRPNNTLQTAFFSSRGPTADARIALGLVAPGDWDLLQGADGGLSFASGTSFSSPTVAGAAALLWAGDRHPKATAIRNALIAGANPKLLGDESTVFDHGGGFLDVAKSLSLLKKHRVSDAFPTFPPHSARVKDNLHAVGLSTTRLTTDSPLDIHAHNLVPGEPHEVIVEIGDRIGSVQVQVNKVTPRLGPDGQNQLFGDDIILGVHQAELTSIGQVGDYPVFEFVNSPQTFTVDNPQPGFMRVMIYGDWTNAGKVSADITVTATKKSEGKPVFQRLGSINDGEIQSFAVNVPDGIDHARLQLAWLHDWRHYPTNDIDLVLIDPSGNEIDDGATLSAPETVSVDKPAAGVWTIYVIGFDVWGRLQDDGSERGPRTDVFSLKAFTD